MADERLEKNQWQKRRDVVQATSEPRTFAGGCLISSERLLLKGRFVWREIRYDGFL